MAPPKTRQTRFAPSPTGYLHLGHIVSALYVWGLAARWGASVFLRIEDHDRGRCRLEYEQAIFDDLRWLGFQAANHFFTPGQTSSFRQSDSESFYLEALSQLKTTQKVYGCICSRKEILEHQRSHSQGSKEEGRENQASHQSQSDDTFGELRYPGTCRHRNISPDQPGVSIRLALPDQDVPFSDLNMGPQMQNPWRQCGDLLLRDRHGNWTYQFAVTVDDLRHRITHVIRGMDLLPSTARQVLLGQWLGRTEPVQFYHHPLILDETGRKLGKRFFSTAISKRRAGGESPESLLGEAAYLAGILPRLSPISLQELLQHMSGVGGCP